MTKLELIKKWEEEKEMYKRICKDSLMYTKEERVKASSKLIILVAILTDIEDLKCTSHL
jgi:hypothetical protein